MTEGIVKDFIHNGLPCRIVRHERGHLCGYVGIPREHPWYGKIGFDPVKVPRSRLYREVDLDKIGVLNLFSSAVDYEENEKKGCLALVLALDVHGGVTYAHSCPPFENEPAGYWWLGFDCAHVGDNPAKQDEPYVMGECRALADQLCSISVVPRLWRVA